MSEHPGQVLPEDDFMAELHAEFAAKCRLELPVLQHAQENGEWHTLAAMAHDIKGTAPVFGYEQAGETARQLEAAAKTAQREETARLLAELVAQLPMQAPQT